MQDQDRTKAQLLEELAALRQRVAELEAAVREPERGAALLLQTAPLGIHECDAEGRITLVNSAQESITGYTAEELLGTFIWDRIEPGPEKDSLPAYLKRLVLEQPPPTPFVARNIRKNGEVFEVRIDWSYKRDPQGKVVGFVSIVTDVTQERKAQAALRESEQRYRTLAESTTDVVYIVDENGTLLYANQTAAAYLGLTPAALVGKRQRDLFPPDVADLHIERLRRVFQTGEAGEMDSPYRFGAEEAWFNVRSIPLRDDQGQITSVMGVCRNITERKRAEETLQKAHDELEKEVRNRTGELAIFRQFAEASGQGFGMANMDGLITYMNPALCRMAGVERPKDAIGRHLTTCYPEEYRRRRETEIIPALLQEGHWEGETVFSSGGKTTFVLQNSFLIRDENGNPSRLASIVTDITERKRAEEALRTSEERFRSYFDQGLIGMAVTRLDKQWREVNDRLCEMLGYPREELLKMKWTEATHPDDLEPGELQFNRIVAGEIDHYTQEKRFIRKDGELVYANVFVRCFRRADGTVDHFLALIEDVTERRQAQNALRRSEERYRTVVEDQTEVICRITADGTFTFVNEVFCRFFGKTSQELLGHKWQTVAVDDDLPMVEDQLRALSPTNPVVVVENRVNSGLGQVRWMQFVNRGFIDQAGRLTEIQAVGRDITEQKQALGALQQSHDELRAIYDGMVSGLLIADVETKRFARTNAAICRMLGYSTEELLSMSVKDIHSQEDLPAVLETFQALAEGHITFKENIPLLRKDGSVFYADVGGKGIVYDGRRCLIGFFRDTTERRRTQELLQRDYRTLKHLLQSSDHERQTIAYEIHDGLTQQLAGAIMQFQTFAHLKDNKPRLAAKAYDAGMTMLQQGHFEARRLIAGVRPPILDEAGVVEAIAHLVHEQSRLKGPDIEYRNRVKFDRLAPTLENAIYRIAQEGLANACQHSKSKNVRVSLLEREDRVRIEIQDWGVGFDKKAVQENRFGLEGIRQRTRLLGGKCSIRSTSGRGTRITVELPVVGKEPSE